ncbi:C2H2 type zinc-finger domain-containing protein [Spironucleus salmonicida]|uniref:C2H2 type zinc-finger domain-containing protein n=1 Tax=Spironucleus salmonicida TaxID=348837 RepID=A0A9P8S0U3_9EUKA|nr:C2H2 type zinc-finger domain-containing protein [Spironucleus salmonicida]
MKCSNCQLLFTKDEYFIHIKTNFHKLNVQRNITTRPLTYDEYYDIISETKAAKQANLILNQSTELNIHDIKLENVCLFCSFKDTPLSILYHMKIIHSYQFIHLECLLFEEEFLQFLLLNQYVYKQCLFCNQQFQQSKHLINHQKRNSHEKYVLNQSISYFFDFTHTWPMELQNELCAKLYPFQLWDRESVLRFQQKGLLGDKKVLTIKKLKIIDIKSHIPTLMGKVTNPKLKRHQNENFIIVPSNPYCYIYLILFVIFLLIFCLILSKFSNRI